jgi:diguanylate cyclase (GGDEF)-like protein
MRFGNLIKKNRGYFLVVIIVSVLWGLLLYTFISSSHNYRDEILEVESLKEKEHYEAILNDTFAKMEIVKVFVEVKQIDNITQTEFDEFTDKMDFSGIGFLSLNIAPDGVIAFYYSEVLSEEDLIGYNFFEDTRQSVIDAINYSIEHDVIVVNGPIDLLLADQGIVLRRAIFEDDTFVGLISLIIDYNQLQELLNENSSDVVDVGVYRTDNSLIFGDLPYDERLELKTIGLDEVDWRIGLKISDDFARESLTIDAFIYLIGNILYITAISFGSIIYFKNKRLILEQIRLINYDQLTQLPNRRLLTDDVNKAISENRPFYLGFGDLDNFKNLNDILGHSVGDKFLIDITERLNETIDDIFHVYRWGGDEFIFLIFTGDKQVATKYLDKLYEKILDPILINEAKYNIQISIGVVQYPRHGITVDDLIKHADIVMYDIKSQKRNTYGFFENKYLDHLQREVDFENKVNKYSIDDFQLYLQPVLNTKTDEIYGFEALTRLIDEKGQVLNTFEVIKVLERKGEIPKLDKHVFNTLCIYSRKIHEESGKRYVYSFNISPITLSDEFVEFLKEKVKEHKINPKDFVMEVTETLGFKDVDASVNLLRKIKQIGFGIAMDDFGIGYSSLSYIARLPLDIIKIDRYFIQNYYDNEFEKLIIYSILDISKSLKLKIVVEGIETPRQLEFIKQINAHFYQGYIHSKPMSLDNLLKHLKEGF